MKIRVCAIIFARTSSSRLRKKALLPINGSDLITNVINVAKKIDAKLILATSHNIEDDVLAERAIENNITVFRGGLDNVAFRTYECLNNNSCDYFIRINGDSIFVPYQEINQLLQNPEFLEYDIISNIIERTFPYGYSIEIIKTSTFLENIDSFNDSEKEHITSYFYNNKDKFKIKSILSKFNKLDLSKVVLTIDFLKDYENMLEMFNFDTEIQYKGIDNIIDLYSKITEKKL